MIIIKSDPEIDIMRQAGRITAGARTIARQMVAPGVTTRQINREVHKFITKSGATPCFMTDGGSKSPPFLRAEPKFRKE